MNTLELIEKIKKKAALDARKRRDPRYRETMGFLVAKGFLRSNEEFHLLPNKRLRIEDVIWAGKNVEPRILEVLPAAVLRLEKHFDLDETMHRELFRVLEQLRKRKQEGSDFYGIPYEKIRIWTDLPLRDGRVKTVSQKKVKKAFRLSPIAIEKLQELAEKFETTETEVIEQLLLRHRLR